MKHRSRFLARTVGWGVAAALALAVLTPMDADAHGRKWKKHRRVETHRVVVVQPRPVFDRYVYSFEPAHRAVIRYEGDRFLWSAAVGFYVPSVWVNVDIGNAPPRGMVYYDPYCDRSFASLRTYRSHLVRGGHPEVLSFRAVAYGSRHDDCGYDGPRDDYYGPHDHAEWYDD